MYKVVIPSAGLGSRVAAHSPNINKALITIGNKPVISHVIDKFKKDVEIIVLLGHHGSYVRQSLEAIYPDRKISFIDVELYQGEGSGLGLTLGCAEHLLQCPFIFISNDTIIPDEVIDLDPNIMGNWMAYYTATEADSFNTSVYRTVEIDSGVVTNINPKGIVCPNIYVGLCGVKDYAEFWKSMDTPRSIPVGESYGLKFLNNIKAVPVPSWCDTGNVESLLKTRELLETHEFNIVHKNDEAIWFYGNRVIKFSVDDKFISDRVKRLQGLGNQIFPSLIHVDKNLYVYNRIVGDVVSKTLNGTNVIDILDFAKKEMWDNTSEVTPELVEACYSFYRDKTFKRVQQFFDVFECVDTTDTINGVTIPPMYVMLNRVDWRGLCDKPHASKYHGDFHNENILVTPSGNPMLIDWRQNFGYDNLGVGDAYYDFAKFMHGLIVSHHQILCNHFTVERDSANNITIDILRPHRLVEAEETFVKWLDENGYDSNRVRLLTALIFLNIAALHEYPYSLYLFYLGKHLLNKYLVSQH